MTDTPVIEAQLLRWSESHNGRTVTLQLPADGDHPFRGLPCGPANGQRLAVAVALINDDETTTPVEPPSTAPEKPASGGNGNGADRPKGGRLAQQAGIVCGEGAFRKFLFDKYPGAMVTADGDVAAAVRALCQVSTRAEFDCNYAAAQRWHNLHGEYIAWMNAP